MASATENGHHRVNGRRTWGIVIGLTVAVVVLAAFVSLHRSQVAVRIGRAARETITQNIATNGKIEALNKFEAFTPAGPRSGKTRGGEGVLFLPPVPKWLFVAVVPTAKPSPKTSPPTARSKP